MTISITHSFVSPVLDAGRPGEVGPDEWNANHTITGITQADVSGLTTTSSPVFAGLTLNATGPALLTLNHSATIAEATGYAGAVARIAQNWNTTSYQSDLYLTGLVTGNTGSTGYEKIALFIEVFTNDPSTVVAGAFTQERILTAVDSRAMILNSVATGLVIGFYAESSIQAGGTGDGYLVAGEYAAVNNGSDQSALNTVTSKIGLHVVADGTVNSTAAVMIDNTGSVAWHTGLYSATASLASSGKFLSLYNEGGAADVFYVDKSGNTVTTGVYKVGSNQVVGARDTGWTNAMTGTPDKATTYDTSTVTLEQLAGRVMALEAMLRTHGLLGV